MKIGILGLRQGWADAGSRLCAARARGRARVVKAFDIVLADVMIDPALSGGTPDMFIAGNDAGAKELVGSWLRAFGWP